MSNLLTQSIGFLTKSYFYLELKSAAGYGRVALVTSTLTRLARNPKPRQRLNYLHTKLIYTKVI